MQPEGANNLRQTRAGADVVNQMAKIYSSPAGRSKQPYKAKSGVDCDYFVLIAAMNPYPAAVQAICKWAAWRVRPLSSPGIKSGFVVYPGAQWHEKWKLTDLRILDIKIALPVWAIRGLLPVGGDDLSIVAEGAVEALWETGEISP